MAVKEDGVIATNDSTRHVDESVGTDPSGTDAMSADQRCLVYIGGYGRSGSTVLCAVVGSLPEAVGVGEFRRLFSCFLKRRPCACGETLDNCDYWSRVLRRFGERFPHLSFEEAHRITQRCERGLSSLPGLRPPADMLATYREIWSSLIDICLAESGARILVDSSKSSQVSADRARRLGDILPVVQVQLVRDPRAVVLSMLKAQAGRVQRNTARKRPASTLQTLAAWSWTNLYQWLSTRRGDPSRRLVVRYEDFTSDPAATIEAMGRQWRLDVAPVVDALRNDSGIDAEHVFSGDKLRRSAYHVKPSVDKWRQELTPVQRGLTWLVYPIARGFGYMTARDGSTGTGR